MWESSSTRICPTEQPSSWLVMVFASSLAAVDPFVAPAGATIFPNVKFQWTSRLFDDSGKEAPTVGPRAWMGEVVPEGGSAPVMGTRRLRETLAHALHDSVSCHIVHFF
jgi:hypothetical protein